MRIGDLDKRVSLQYITRAPDGMGGFSTSFVTAATVFAAVWSISAAEQIKANAPVMVATHRIRIRYRLIKASWRVLYNGRYFSVVSITDPNEAHEWLDLLCREVVA